jgi:magnesium-transporting ATPase (P-type)
MNNDNNLNSVPLLLDLGPQKPIENIQPQQTNTEINNKPQINNEIQQTKIENLDNKPNDLTQSKIENLQQNIENTQPKIENTQPKIENSQPQQQINEKQPEIQSQTISIPIIEKPNSDNKEFVKPLEEIKSKDFSALKLSMLTEEKIYKTYCEDFGGINGVLKILNVTKQIGVTSKSVEERIKLYGENTFAKKRPKPLIKLFFNALNQALLIVLLILGFVSIVLGVAFPEGEDPVLDRILGAIEGLAIFLAVFIVASVSAVNDWQKERKFQELNEMTNEIKIKCIRDGINVDVLISNIIAGEIINLSPGDKIPADGLMVETNDLATNESVMTGETKEIKKTIKDPFMLSGTVASSGCGIMVATAVGKYSQWGKTLASLSTEFGKKKKN